MADDDLAQVVDVVSTAVVPVNADSFLLESAPVDDVVQAMETHHELCRSLLTRDDYQSVGSKQFIKKSGWRKLAVAYGVSCEMLSQEIDRDDGLICRAQVVVRATAPNGRFNDGIGVCSAEERGFSKPEHDIPATAFTRAQNRACSDLFGLGEVSAEEIGSEGAWSDGPSHATIGGARVPTPPAKPPAPSTDATKAQVKYLLDLCVKANLSAEQLASDRYRLPVDRLNKVQIGALISALKDGTA